MPFAEDMRQTIYEAVEEACTARPHPIDMNAALYEQDRSGPQRSALDRQHRAFIEQGIVGPTEKAPRDFTHTVRTMDSLSPVNSSRIDDILVTPGIQRHLSASCTSVLQATDDSDHRFLLAAIEVGKFGFAPPLDISDQEDHKAASPKFVYPIKKAQLLEFRSRFEGLHGPNIHNVNVRLEQAVTEIQTATAEWDLPTSLETHNHFHSRRRATASDLGNSNAF